MPTFQLVREPSEAGEGATRLRDNEARLPATEFRAQGADPVSLGTRGLLAVAIHSAEAGLRPVAVALQDESWSLDDDDEHVVELRQELVQALRSASERDVDRLMTGPLRRCFITWITLADAATRREIRVNRYGAVELASLAEGDRLSLVNALLRLVEANLSGSS